MSTASADIAWWRHPLRDILAGTVGGLLGRVIEYPFDTVKVRMQTAMIGSGRHYNGAVDCFLRTLREEGMKGLYRGMALPLAATVVETSTLFFANGFLKRMLSERGHLAPGEELPMPMVLTAGAGTGLFVSFVLTPIELVKCRLQVTSGPASAYSGPIDCLVKSVQKEGMRVVYRGHLATMLREIPGTACWFGAYESFARYMTPAGKSRDEAPTWVIIVAGALGGMSYWSIMYPCDTVKSAMQIAEAPAAAIASETCAATAAIGATSSSSGTLRPTAATLARNATALAVLQTRTVRLTPASNMSAATASAQRVVSFCTSSLTRCVTSSPTTSAPAPAVAAFNPTFMGTFRSIYATAGMRGLYSGFVPTILRAAPSNAAIFIGYEWANSKLKNYM